MFVKEHGVALIFENGAERDVYFQINQDRHTGLYWAEAKGFGCSRNHAYWIYAVDELCRAHLAQQMSVLPAREETR